MPAVLTSVVFDKLLNEIESGARYIAMEGSSRSTKTYSIIQYIITSCLNAHKPLRVAIIRERLTWLKTTVFEDFKDIMTDQFGIWDERNLNKTEMVYNLNGSSIHFTGLDKVKGRQKAHGMKTDILFLNEVTELDYEAVRQLLMRNPGIIILDYNPNCGDEFWVFTRIMKRERAVLIHSTYKDNPFISQVTIDEIEGYEPTPENIARGTADETYWKIYGLGIRAIVKGLVFEKYNIIQSLPIEFDDRSNGLDFGFTNDPSTLIHTLKFNGELYYDELFYKRGLTSIINPANPDQPSIQEEFERLNITKRIKIWGDSARPEMIVDLKGCGYNIDGVVKGPGSILAGINVMKQYVMNITERSLNMIREVKNYKWKERPEDSTKYLDEPVDKFNHCIDASRYSVSSQFRGHAGRRARYDKTIERKTGVEKYDAF